MVERITHKWWFFLVLIMVTFIPSVTEKTVPPKEIPLLIAEVLQNPVIYQFPPLFPVTKVAVLALLILTVLYGNRMKMIFPLISSILLGLISIFQNAAIETQYGRAFLLGNFIAQSVVVFFWFYEAFKRHNDFSKARISFWRTISLLLGIFAFWMPAQGGYMSFSNGFIENEAALTYCMITPLLLSFLFLYFPNVNIVKLRATSLVGLIFGVLNMVTWFILNTEFWWMGVLHLPLLINSIVGIIISNLGTARKSYNTCVTGHVPPVRPHR